MKIEELNFSVRTYNCLKRGKIDTVEQLRETSDDDLMAIRCFGISCLKEVHQKLGQDPPRKKRVKHAEDIADARLPAMKNRQSLPWARWT